MGDKAKFGLEFAGSTLRPSASNQPLIRQLGHGAYEVRAQVLSVDLNVWAIDFGLRAFCESTPPEFAESCAWIEGELLVGIDPFFYMESLYRLPGMPSLFYNWRVTAIARNDTPWLVDVNARCGKMLSRDEVHESWTNVLRTDAWNDDEGRTSYVVTVERDDV